MEELANGSILVCFLPADVTNLIQPMDQDMIQNFKMYHQSDFIKKLTNHAAKIH
jgi:hypothetical protein